MNKIFTKVYSSNELPFLELRYSNSNKHYKKHFHSCFSLGINKEGISIYTNKNKKYTLDKNKLSIIDPFDVHACNSCGESLNKYYMMFLDTSWCFNIQKSINPTLREYKPVSVEMLKDKEFYKRFLALCEFIFEDNSIDEKQSELINFFMDFFALYLEEKSDTKTNEKFDEVIFFFNENYLENISLENLATKFGLNEFSLIRLFKVNKNMTPHAYIINLRINKSRELLKQGNSIVDTALSCGFYDQSHFHRNFLKHVATTPKEYQLNFVQ